MDSISLLLNALRVSESTVFCNAQIKRYPDGSAVVTVFDRNIIRAPGFEACGAQERPEAVAECSSTPEKESGREAANLARSKRRARTAVFDIAMATDFDLFATFTVSPEKVKDRLDDGEVFGHLHDWLDNNVRRRGLAYVLVPEYHKKGGLHFHALMNDALPMVDSGRIIRSTGGKPKLPAGPLQRSAWLAAGGHPVYNLPGWGWGFSAAIRLYGDRAAAVGYVTKYISKNDRKIGGRWYYSGGELRRPQVTTCKLDFDRASWYGPAFDIDELGARGVRLRIEKEDTDEMLEELRGTAWPVRDRDV